MKVCFDVDDDVGGSDEIILRALSEYVKLKKL
jgi:hypothetical protein